MNDDRINLTLERLAGISADLKAIVAVHEERLNKQEKSTDDIYENIERRREESDSKLREVYETMRSQDNIILQHIDDLRKESTDQHSALNGKISKLERYIWIAIGGGMTGVWLVSYVANYFKIMGH